MQTDILAKARDFFGQDRFAAAAGIQIDAIAGDDARCHLQIGDRHLNSAGTVMGGALFTLADFTFAVGANAAFLRGDGQRTVAADCHIQYLSAARRGRLTAHAVALKSGRKLCFYRVDITDEQGARIASAHCTGCRVP